MDGKEEILAIANENSKLVIDTSIIIEYEINIGELKLLVYILEEQLKQETPWIKIESKEVGEKLNISEISIQRWIKKLKTCGLLEQYAPRSLMWKVPKKVLKKMEVTNDETKTIELNIKELKEYLNKLQGKNLMVEINYLESLVMKGIWKDFKFYEENIDRENGFVIESVAQRSKTKVKEKDIASSQLIISCETILKITATGAIITISDI